MLIIYNSLKMNTQVPEKLSQTQRERIAYIEFLLYFFGEASRADLITRFGIAPAGSTRDFAMYREVAPDNIVFEGKRKIYVIGQNFNPVFHHPSQRILTALTLGFGDGLGGENQKMICCDFPPAIIHTPMNILASMSRAIHRKKAVRLNYHSPTIGSAPLEIVPFALVDNGFIWQVRAYDRQSSIFRDFAISRIKNPEILEYSPLLENELAAKDIQWNRVIEMELIPHPNRPHPEITEMDYALKDGILKINARAANVGYMLQRWRVDCSSDRSLQGDEYRLCLKDHLVLYGVSNAALAPGYKIK